MEPSFCPTRRSRSQILIQAQSSCSHFPGPFSALQGMYLFTYEMHPYINIYVSKQFIQSDHFFSEQPMLRLEFKLRIASVLDKDGSRPSAQHFSTPSVANVRVICFVI